MVFKLAHYGLSTFLIDVMTMMMMMMMIKCAIIIIIISIIDTALVDCVCICHLRKAMSPIRLLFPTRNRHPYTLPIYRGSPCTYSLKLDFWSLL